MAANPPRRKSREMEEIDELASELTRHLTVFQMEVGHNVPAPILAAQVGIIARQATRLQQLLRENPTARVSIDPRFNEGMEQAYLDVLGISTDVPDELPKDWR